MGIQSAGILLYRQANNELQVFLVHPGGPFFKNKDAGVWSIPKGEFTNDEEPITAAKREFLEETGSTADGNFIPLTPVKLKSGKTIYAWALEGDIDHESIVSNIFEMEWPPKSGKKQSFPEIDRAAWFDVDEARSKLNGTQAAFIDDLLSKVN